MELTKLHSVIVISFEVINFVFNLPCQNFIYIQVQETNESKCRIQYHWTIPEEYMVKLLTRHTIISSCSWRKYIYFCLY